MKKYWIIVDGNPAGPFTSSELKARRDFVASLPVWSNDLPDWTTVGELPELACLLEVVENTVDQAESDSRGVEPPAIVPPAIEAQEPCAPATHQPSSPAPGAWIPRQPSFVAAVAPVGEKRPKSYIGWSIAMLFCCCLVGGVVGLVFGSQVNTRWERGDFEGARKASEAAEWCVIISIVLGLISWPFQLIFSGI